MRVESRASEFRVIELQEPKFLEIAVYDGFGI